VVKRVAKRTSGVAENENDNRQAKEVGEEEGRKIHAN